MEKVNVRDLPPLARTLSAPFGAISRPLREKPGDQFLLAIQGPYRVMRHPRYAAEAVLNIVLFLFTGIWISLLGVMGWLAIYHQARAEEGYLMRAAGRVYAEYCRSTGMFFPKPRLR